MGDEKSIKSIYRRNSPSIINESEISNCILKVDNPNNLNAVNKLDIFKNLILTLEEQL